MRETERITIPFNEEDSELLKKEAVNQGRTFSGYMQRILGDHIKKENKGKSNGPDIKS